MGSGLNCDLILAACFRQRRKPKHNNWVVQSQNLVPFLLILDPADLTERELEDILDPWEEVRDPLDPEGYAERVKKSTFPGQTFRVLKGKEIRQFGEYRTRRLVLEAWRHIEKGKREV